MNRWQNHFSFRGRTARQRYWLTNLVLIAVWVVVSLVSRALVPLSSWLELIAVPVLAVLLWVYLANTTRRLHDRSKSAWWLIVFVGCPTLSSLLRGLMALNGASSADGPSNVLLLVSSGFSTWALVELGFLKGAGGSNEFGDDPLMPTADVFA